LEGLYNLSASAQKPLLQEMNWGHILLRIMKCVLWETQVFFKLGEISK